MGNLRLFTGINGPVDKVSADSFRFHGPMKAMFYRLLKLINPPPPEWLDRVTGNNAVLVRIYREVYLKHEKQAWRRETLERVIPFGILLTADGSDENYGEVFESFLYEICQAYDRGEFTFDPLRITPECWFQDGRGRLNFHETIRMAMRQKPQSNPGKISRDISETEQGLRSD